jgi:hypothetical protein
MFFAFNLDQRTFQNVLWESPALAGDQPSLTSSRAASKLGAAADVDFQLCWKSSSV